MRAIWLATVLIAVAVAASEVAVAAAPPSPRAMVLTPADVGDRYSVASARFSTNARVAKASDQTLADLKRRGRINGYDIEFERQVTVATALQGPLTVSSSASLYRAAAGAKRSWREVVAAIDKAIRGKSASTFERLPLKAKLGNGARMYGITQKTEDFTSKAFVVVWWTSRALNSVTVTGLEDGVAPADAVRLAQKQEKRVRRAFGIGGPKA